MSAFDDALVRAMASRCGLEDPDVFADQRRYHGPCAGFEPHALKVSTMGAPWHPLYLPASSMPVPYKGEVHPKCYAWAKAKKAV